MGHIRAVITGGFVVGPIKVVITNTRDFVVGLIEVLIARECVVDLIKVVIARD